MAIMVTNKKKTLYDVLGVSQTDDAPIIVAAYRRLALKLHPDKPEGDEGLFKEVNTAYTTLKDPESRERYDLELTRQPGHENSRPRTAASRDDGRSHPGRSDRTNAARIPRTDGMQSSNKVPDADVRLSELGTLMERKHRAIGDRLGLWFAEFRKATETLMMGTSLRWRRKYASGLIELLLRWSEQYRHSEFRQAGIDECALMLQELMERTAFASQPAADSESVETARFIVQAMGAFHLLDPSATAESVRSVARRVRTQAVVHRDAWVDLALGVSRSPHSGAVSVSTIPAMPSVFGIVPPV